MIFHQKIFIKIPLQGNPAPFVLQLWDPEHEV